jgi:hypothetical protein
MAAVLVELMWAIRKELKQNWKEETRRRRRRRRRRGGIRCIRGRGRGTLMMIHKMLMFVTV